MARGLNEMQQQKTKNIQDVHIHSINEDEYLKLCLNPNGLDAAGLTASGIDIFIELHNPTDDAVEHARVRWKSSGSASEKFTRNASFSSACWDPSGTILFVGTSEGALIALTYQREKQIISYLFGTSLKQTTSGSEVQSNLLELQAFPTADSGSNLVLFGLLSDGLIAILENNQNMRRPKIKHFRTLSQPLRLTIFPTQVTSSSDWHCDICVCNLDEYQWIASNPSTIYELHRFFIPQPMLGASPPETCLHDVAYFSSVPALPYSWSNKDIDEATQKSLLNPILCILCSFPGGFSIVIIQKYTYTPIYLKHIYASIVGGVFCVLPRCLIPSGRTMLPVSSEVKGVLGVCLIGPSQMHFLRLPHFELSFECNFPCSDTQSHNNCIKGDIVGAAVPTVLQCVHRAQFIPKAASNYDERGRNRKQLFYMWLLGPPLSSSSPNKRSKGLYIISYQSNMRNTTSKEKLTFQVDASLEEIYQKIGLLVEGSTQKPFVLTENASSYFRLSEQLLLQSHQFSLSQTQLSSDLRTDSDKINVISEAAISIATNAVCVCFTSSSCTREFLYYCIQFFKEFERTSTLEIWKPFMILQRAITKLNSYELIENFNPKIMHTGGGDHVESRSWRGREWISFLNEDTAEQCAAMARKGKLQQMMILFNTYTSSFDGQDEEERDLQVLPILKAIPSVLPVDEENLLPKWLRSNVIPLLKKRDAFFEWLVDRTTHLEEQSMHFRRPLHLLSCIFENPCVEGRRASQADMMEEQSSNHRGRKVVMQNERVSGEGNNSVMETDTEWMNGGQEFDFSYFSQSETPAILSPLQYISSGLFWISHGASCRSTLGNRMLNSEEEGGESEDNTRINRMDGNTKLNSTENLWRIYTLLVECYNIQKKHDLHLRLSDFLKYKMSWTEVAYQLLDRVASPNLLRDEVAYHLKSFCETHGLVVDEVLHGYVGELLDTSQQDSDVAPHKGKQRERRAVALMECMDNGSYRADSLLKLLRLPMTAKTMGHELKELLENVKSLNIDNNRELLNRIAFWDIQRLLDKYSFESAAKVCRDAVASRRLIYHVLSRTEDGVESYLDALKLLKHFRGLKDHYLDDADACCMRLRYLCKGVKASDEEMRNQTKEEKAWQTHFSAAAAVTIEILPNIHMRVKAVERFVCFVWECLEEFGGLLSAPPNSSTASLSKSLVRCYKQQCRMLTYAACVVLRHLWMSCTDGLDGRAIDGTMRYKDGKAMHGVDVVALAAKQWVSREVMDVLTRLQKLMEEFDMYVRPSAIQRDEMEDEINWDEASHLGPVSGDNGSYGRQQPHTMHKIFDEFALPYVTYLAEEMFSEFTESAGQTKGLSPFVPFYEKPRLPSAFASISLSQHLPGGNASGESPIAWRNTHPSSALTKVLRMGQLIGVDEVYIKQSIIQAAAIKVSPALCMRMVQELEKYSMPHMTINLVNLVIQIFTQLHKTVETVAQPSKIIEMTAQLLEVLAVCARLSPPQSISYIVSLSLDVLWVFQLLVQSDLLDKGGTLTHSIEERVAITSPPFGKRVKSEDSSSKRQYVPFVEETLIFLMAFSVRYADSAVHPHHPHLRLKEAHAAVDVIENPLALNYFRGHFKEIHSLIPSKSALPLALKYLHLKNQYRTLDGEIGWWAEGGGYKVGNLHDEELFVEAIQSSYLNVLNPLECYQLGISLLIRHPLYVERLNITQTLLAVVKEAFTKVVRGPDPVDKQLATVLSAAFVNKDAWQIFLREGLSNDNVKLDYNRFCSIASLGSIMGYLHGDKLIVKEMHRLAKLSKWASVARHLQIPLNETEYFRRSDTRWPPSKLHSIQRGMLESLIISGGFDVEICLEFGQDSGIKEEEVIIKIIELFLCSPSVQTFGGDIEELETGNDRTYNITLPHANTQLVIDTPYRYFIPPLVAMLPKAVATKCLFDDVLPRISPYDYERLEFVYSFVDNKDVSRNALAIIKMLKTYRRCIAPTAGELRDVMGYPMVPDGRVLQALENLASHRLPYHKLTVKPWEVLGPEINEKTVHTLKLLSSPVGILPFEFELQLIWNLARQAVDGSMGVTDANENEDETPPSGLSSLTVHLTTVFRNEPHCAIAASLLLLERLSLCKMKLRLSEWCVKHISMCSLDTVDLEMGQPRYQKLHLPAQSIQNVKKWIVESNSFLQTQWELQQCHLSQFSVFLPHDVELCVECLYFYIIPIVMQYTAPSLKTAAQQLIHNSLADRKGDKTSRKDKEGAAHRTLHTVVDRICGYYQVDAEKLRKMVVVRWLKNADKLSPYLSYMKKQNENSAALVRKVELSGVISGASTLDQQRNFFKSMEQSHITAGLEAWYTPLNASNVSENNSLFTASKALTFIQNPQDALCVLRTAVVAEGISEDQRVKLLLTLFFDEHIPISCKCRIGAVLFRTCSKEGIERRYKKFADLSRIWLHFFYVNAFDELKIPQEFGKFYRTEKTGLARSLMRQYTSVSISRDKRLLQLICYMCVDFTIRDGCFLSEILSACLTEGLHEFLKNFLFLLHKQLLHQIPLDMALTRTLEHLMRIPVVDAMTMLQKQIAQLDSKLSHQQTPHVTKQNQAENIANEENRVPKNPRTFDAEDESIPRAISPSISWFHCVPMFIYQNPARSFFDIQNLFDLHLQYASLLLEILIGQVISVSNTRLIQRPCNENFLQCLSKLFIQLTSLQIHKVMNGSDAFSGFVGISEQTQMPLYSICNFTDFSKLRETTHSDTGAVLEGFSEQKLTVTQPSVPLESHGVGTPAHPLLHPKIVSTIDGEISGKTFYPTNSNDGSPGNGSIGERSEASVINRMAELYNLGLLSLLMICRTAVNLLKIIPSYEAQNAHIIKETVGTKKQSIVPFIVPFCSPAVKQQFFETILLNRLVEVYYNITSLDMKDEELAEACQRSLEAFHRYAIEKMQIKQSIEILLLKSDSTSLKRLIDLLNNYIEFHGFSHKKGEIINFIAGRTKSEQPILYGLSSDSLRAYEHIKTAIRTLRKQENLNSIFPYFMELLASGNAS